VKAAALVLLAALAGCLPNVVWSGHSADRRHRLEVVRESGRQRVVVDGAGRGVYAAVAVGSVASVGSRFVFAARTGAAWIVVDPGRPSPRWDGIGEIAVHGRRTAYVAERAGRWHVVVDGEVGPGWDAVLAHTLRFSPTGDRVAYVARDAAGIRVVVGTDAGPAWDGVAQLTFSADGAHVAYVARGGEKSTGAQVVVDATVGPRYLEVDRLTLDGKRAVYRARAATGWHVIAGAPSPAYLRVREIATRGGHVAWIAEDGDGDLVACDGAVVARGLDGTARGVAIARGCDVVFAVERDGGVHVHRGGSDQRYDEVGRFVVGAEARVAFAARRGATWYLVDDGRLHVAGTYAGDPVFSADGTRLAYVAREGRRWVAIVDGRAFRFDVIVDDTLAFSRDGRRWAVIGGDLAREQMFFAVDGTRRVPLAAEELYSAVQRNVATAAADPGAVLRAWAAAEADKR
jgi:hypothetical protein